MRSSVASEASESEMLKFFNLIKNGNADAIAAHEAYKSSSDKRQFHQDIMRVCRSQSQGQNTAQPPKPKLAPAAPRPTVVMDAPPLVVPERNGASLGETNHQSAVGPKPNLKVCRGFSTKGGCRFGDKCKYAHEDPAARAAAEAPRAARPADKKEKSKRAAKVRNAREGSGSNPTAGDAVDDRIADHQAKPAVSEAPAPACSIEAGKVETDGEGSEPVQTNDTSCTLRLQDLLGNNSNSSPLLGGLGIGPHGVLSGGLMQLPPSMDEGDTSIYQGSKLSGKLELEYFLEGIPGFTPTDNQQLRGRSTAFEYNPFEIPEGGDANSSNHSPGGSSLFHHDDSNARTEELQQQQQQNGSSPHLRSVGDRPRSSHPPGLHPDDHANGPATSNHHGSQREIRKDTASQSPHGQSAHMPPPGMAFPPHLAPPPGYMDQKQFQGFPGHGPYPGGPPYMDPYMFGIPPFGMMPMPMHPPGDGELPAEIGHMGMPYGPEFVGGHPMPPFYNPGMPPMHQPPFVHIPGSIPPQFIVPSPAGGYMIINEPPMNIYGAMGPQDGKGNHSEGDPVREQDSSALQTDGKTVDQVDSNVDTESDKPETPRTDEAQMPSRDAAPSPNSTGPAVNTAKTNMLKSLLGKCTSPEPMDSPLGGVSQITIGEPAEPVGATASQATTDTVVDDGDVDTKKTHTSIFRVSKQVKGGEMTVFMKPSGQNGRGARGRPVFVPPGGPIPCNQAMSVQWQLPETVIEESKRSAGNLVIGLHRMGTSLNSSSVVSKGLISSSKGTVILPANGSEGRMCRGEMFFFAPKAAGSYVFRIFDQSSKEKAANTMCTSPRFEVVISGRDVTTNLRYAYDLIKSHDSEVMGVISLRTGILGMETTGVPANGDNPVDLLNKSVDSMFAAIVRGESTQSSEPDTTVRELRAESIADGEEPKSGDVSAAERKARALTEKLFVECYDTMRVIRQSQIAMSMLLPEQTRKLIKHLDFFCPILARFHDSEQALMLARRAKLGFIPASYFGPRTSEMNRLVPQLVDEVSASMHRHLRELLPSQQYFVQREETRSRIEKILNRSGAVSQTRSIKLSVFGSSRNGFGSVGADLDMCIVSDEGETGSSIITDIAAVLNESGMIDVQARATARIPIVLFRDSVSGIDCDISFTNPLALRNTELLQLYSNIDPRVRQLAFIIKHWAKQRHINSPQDGTLGSYAYVLCLVNYLQTRNPPVLPSLQQLPPDWSAAQRTQQHRNRQHPQRLENHPVDKARTCDTYFYSSAVISPGSAESEHVLQELQHFSSQNRQSCGELLINFFAYFAWGFDYRHDVVSVRAGGTVSKIDKCEYCSWPQNDRLSIEDPFETWYDVGHVLKGSQMDYFRRELVRAHTILTRFSQQPVSSLLSPRGVEFLGADIYQALTADKTNNGQADVINVLCDAAPHPPFSAAAKLAAAQEEAPAS